MTAFGNKLQYCKNNTAAKCTHTLPGRKRLCSLQARFRDVQIETLCVQCTTLFLSNEHKNTYLYRVSLKRNRQHLFVVNKPVIYRAFEQ